jgi:hypothetical protein
VERALALAETATRNLESGEDGIPWLCRPVSWSGMGRAVAVTFHRISLGQDEATCSLLLVRRPDDKDEIDVKTGGEWEVISREVWQQERRHGAS